MTIAVAPIDWYGESHYSARPPSTDPFGSSLGGFGGNPIHHLDVAFAFEPSLRQRILKALSGLLQPQDTDALATTFWGLFQALLRPNSTIYVGQEKRRIELVIIDEGFGGLDKNGRNDIIHEFDELQQQLARIILVSHQDEIANGFSNGYAIELINGASQVRLLSASRTPS